jgi:hypothetical protein
LICGTTKLNIFLKIMYSFQIIFDQYTRTSPVLEDVRGVYVSGICIAAKNDKRGQIYISKHVKNVQGKFLYIAGSERYPILYPKSKSVILTVTGFPKFPILLVNEYQGHITIKNVCLDDEKN